MSVESLVGLPDAAIGELLRLRTLLATRPDPSCTSLAEKRRWHAEAETAVALDAPLRAAHSEHYARIADGSARVWWR